MDTRITAPKLKTILGAEYKDIVSGLTGIAVSATAYLHSCERVHLQPQEVKEGKPVEGAFFDYSQLDFVSAGISEQVQRINQKVAGYDGEAPRTPPGGPGAPPQGPTNPRR